MPTVRVDWLVGRSSAQRRELAHVLTAEVCRIAGCQPESVDVIFTDVSPGHWSNAGSLFSEPPSRDVSRETEPLT